MPIDLELEPLSRKARMTWPTTKIHVHALRGIVVQSTTEVYPAPAVMQAAVRDGLLVATCRQSFTHGERKLVATIAAEQVKVGGRLCLMAVVEVANADPSLPAPTDETFGQYAVSFVGCHAVPLYGLSLGGQLEAYTPQETYVYRFPTWEHRVGGVGTTIPTHTARAMRFLVAQPEATETQGECLAWLVDQARHSRWPGKTWLAPQSLSFELPLGPSREVVRRNPEAAFQWSASNPLNLWGFRQYPSGPGDDAEFGSDPWPELRIGLLAEEGALNLDRRLLAYANHQPCWIYDRRHVETPSEEAWLMVGSLSDHSRNRKGLPHRSDVDQLARYKAGWLCEADGIEHTALPALHLAWYTGDAYWCEKAIDYGYWLMNSIHTPTIPISRGGYNSPLYPVPRYHRMLIALEQAQMVANRWGFTFPHAAAAAADFKRFLTVKYQEIHASRWRQDGYPDWVIYERPDDGRVNGKMACAVWQLGFSIQAAYWAALNLPTVKPQCLELISEWTRMVLASWKLETSIWKMGKLLEARPLSTPGWPEAERGMVDARLDGLVYWPYAGLKLVQQHLPDLFDDTATRAKLSTIVADLETRFPRETSGRWGSIAPATPQDPT